MGLSPARRVALGVTLLLLCVGASVVAGGTRRREIHFGRHVMDLSQLPSLSPPRASELLADWIFGRWAAAASVVGFEQVSVEEGKQWYAVLKACAEPERIEAATGAAIGGLIDGEANAFLLTGTEAMARSAAGDECVSWVGARPDIHKIDPVFMRIIDGAQGAEQAKSARPKAAPDALSLARMVVLLLPPGQQHPSGRFTAEDFVRVCEEEFSRRGWAATAAGVSRTRIEVTLDAFAGRALGDDSSSAPEVLAWLASRSEVIYIEPRSLHRPAGRFENKLMASGRGGAEHATPEGQKVLSDVMTSQHETASLDVTVHRGEHSGKYCLSLREVVHVGGADDSANVLAPMADARVRQAAAAGEFYDTDTGPVTTALRLESAGEERALSLFAGDYVGMAVHLPAARDVLALAPRYERTFDGAGANTLVRTVVAHDPGLGILSIHPGVEGTVGVGTRVEILPVWQAGDTVTVRAHATSWSGRLAMDQLPLLPATRFVPPAFDAAELLRLGCDGSGDPHEGQPPLDRLPRSLRALGYGALRTACERDVVEAARLRVPVPAEHPDWPADGSLCADMCPPPPPPSY